ncbi:NAD(P)-dependent oxidoreductase [Gordonia sp. DT30]|uniref:NAD(P)-dependent oxidoreductase n=1 Tax=unclassified Gordonia (in: high G+C Gram-positive bacteria) TaxID=2657482 RepID=UPI003CF7FFA7
MSEDTVGFIGLGNIGLPMAQTLVRGGLKVIAYDRRDEAVDKVVQLGGRAGGSVASVVADAKIIGICVVNDAQVNGVIDELLASPVTDAHLFIIHSTILPATVKSIAERVAPAGVHIVDAQVSGGDLRAADGTLAVMVGGAEADVARCTEYFDALGSKIRHMGPVGAGAATKLALQGMTFTNQLQLLESVRFAALHDVDETALMDIASATTGESFMTRNWGHFDRQLFTHTLAGTEDLYRFYDKDLMCLALAARDEGLSMPLTALSQQLLGPSFKQRKVELDERGTSYDA